MTAESTKEAIMAYASTVPERGAVLHPLRYALTGLDKSPDPFSIIWILGRTESLRRIENAMGHLMH